MPLQHPPLLHSASLVLFAYLCGTTSQFLSVHIVCKVSLVDQWLSKCGPCDRRINIMGLTTESETLSEGPASCVLASPWGLNQWELVQAPQHLFLCPY